jgi:hypothetical protein
MFVENLLALCRVVQRKRNAILIVQDVLQSKVQSIAGNQLRPLDHRIDAMCLTWIS